MHFLQGEQNLKFHHYVDTEYKFVHSADGLLQNASIGQEVGAAAV